MTSVNLDHVAEDVVDVVEAGEDILGERRTGVDDGVEARELTADDRSDSLSSTDWMSVDPNCVDFRGLPAPGCLPPFFFGRPLGTLK